MLLWWIFVHLVGVFGFLIAHGVSVAVAFRLRRERDPARISSLVDLSGSAITALYVSIVVLLLGGVVAGFQLGAWGQGWIWTALILFVVTIALMGAMASPYYKRVRFIARAMATGSEAVTEEQLASVLMSPRPLVVAGLGFASLLVILWLMVLKPF